MKRFSKVIALALLLAVVVSAFGIFSAFAEPASESLRTVIYDMDSLTQSVMDEKTGKFKTGDYLTKTTDQFGQTIWKQGVGAANTDDYWQIGLAGIKVADRTKTTTTVDETTGEETTTTSVVSGSEKNTSYFVLDFDISTDDLLADGIYFHTAFYGNDRAHKTRLQNGYFYLSINNDGHLNIDNAATSGYVDYTPVDVDKEKWINISIIYDATDYDAENHKLNSMTYYIYINGVLAGSQKITKGIDSKGASASKTAPSNFKEAYFFRVSTSAQPGGEDRSVNWANLTVSRFDYGYTGNIAERLGSASAHLSSIPELKYCLENTPKTPENYSNTDPVAKIERGEGDTAQEIVCSSIADLQEYLALGDKVTLYKNISDVLFVPDNSDGSSETLGVTFVDKAGTAIGADGALVSVALLYEVDMNLYDWAIVKSGTTVELGTSTEENTYSTPVYKEGTQTVASYTVADAFYNALLGAASSAKTYAVLFDDITMYGSTSSSISVKNNLTINLNGHKLSVNNRGAKHMFSPAAGSQFMLSNGDLSWERFGNYNLMYFNFVAARGVFYDCNVDIKEDTIIDQRNGLVMYNHCVVNAGGILSSTKAGAGAHGYVAVEYSDVSGSSDAISLSHYGGTGSVILHAYIKGSVFDMEGPVIKYAERVDTKNAAGSIGAKNDNYIYIDAVDSILSTSTSSVFVDAPDWGGRFTATETDIRTVDTDVEFNVSNCTLTASAYIYDRYSTGRYYYPSDYESVAFDFVLNADASSKLSSGLALVNTLVGDYEYDFVDVVFNLENGILLNYPELYSDCENIPVFNVPEGNKLAFTNTNEGYNHIVTSNYTTNTYTKGTAVVDEEFYWNIAENEAVIMEWVTDLAETAAYKYTWATSAIENGTAYTATLAPNFTPSVSMSTDGTLALNLFLPTEVYEALGGENVTFTSELGYEIEKALNADLGQYGKEGSFVQAKVKGIDPSKANETAVTVTFNIIGAYGDSDIKTLNISVVSYAKMVIKNGTSAAEKQYAVQLLNYVKAVMDYAGKNTTAIDDIITESGLTVKAGNVGEAAAGGAVTGIDKFAMNLGGSINWVLTVSGNDTYTVSYTRDGKTVTAERTAENGEIVISLRAYDALGTVTVKNNTDNTSSTFNIANYYATQDENAKAVLTALAAYAETAVAYKAQLDKAN